jgi:hypothetical protein
MSEVVKAGVGAEVFERPSECHTRQPILKTDHTTGLKYWDLPRRRPLCEITLKYETLGLRAFRDGSGLSIWWEYVSADPIGEAEARDAQCRAGWPDTGYGFSGLKTTQLADGMYVAAWKCWVSCD